MTYLVFTLVLCTGLFLKSGFSEKLESQEELLDEKNLYLYNEAYIQKNSVLEDPSRNNTASPCSSNPCKNGGKCTDSLKGFTCKCVRPYKGPTCETGPCTRNRCQNGGICIVGTYSFKCNCTSPYHGLLCEKGPCSSDPCQNNGTCNVVGQGYVCQCKEPFNGPNCEKECNCKNGKCRVTSDDDVVCECLPEFGKKSDDCIACDCETGANCTWESTWFGSKIKYCLCPDGSELEGKHCKELSTTTLPLTKETFPPVSSTKTVSTTSPLLSSSQIFTEITTPNFTEEFRMTSNEPSNFTYNFNRTTYKPLNFTMDFNVTTFEPSNFTNDFNWTTFEPENFTADFKKTTYEPSNLTYDFNLTSYEPSNFTHGFNMTSYQPSNFTNENDISETTPFLSTTNTMPTTMSDICNDDVCEHGKCEIVGRYYRCRCFEGFTGLRCEDRIPNKLDNLGLWQIIQTSIMIFVAILLLGVFCFLLILLRRQG